MKKIYLLSLSLLLCLCFVFALSGCGLFNNEDTSDDIIFKYAELPDGTYEVSIDQIPNHVDPNIVIPSKYNGKTVSRIAPETFKICNFSIESITIPDTIKSIGSFAFADCSIGKITLASSINYIEEYAFNNAEINEIYYDGSISDWCNIVFEVGAEIVSDDIVNAPDIYSSTPLSCAWGDVYFRGSGNSWDKITEITIPTSIKKVGNLQFLGFGDLTKITLHNEISEIGFAAFKGCSSLENITLPESVNVLGEKAFENCISLTTCNLSTNIDVISGYAFFGCENLSTIELTDKITHIEEFAFAGCSSLSFQRLPATITEIDCHSFDNCAFESITIPDTVTVIKDGAFANCDNLIEITFGSNVKTLEKNAFLECTSLDRVNYLGTLNEWASMTFGGGIIYGTDVEETANPIYYSRKLYINDALVTSVTLSDIAKVSEYAFINCSSLTDVSLTDTITTIGDYAFYGCANLKSVAMTNNIETIGTFAFHSCPALDYNIENGVYYLGSQTNKSLVAISPVLARNKVTDIVLADECRVVYYEAFENCTALENVTFNRSLIEIGGQAFYGCTSLLDFSLPTSLKTIKHYAFRDCEKLTVLELPANISYIGFGAFQACASLTSITIPEGVETIESWTFYGCTNLQQISIPSSVKKIESFVFDHCDALQEIIISENNAHYVFSDGCLYNKSKTELIKFIDKTKTTFTIVSSVEKILNGAFWDFHSLTSVYIPKSVVKMEANVFCGNSSLTIYCEQTERPSDWSEYWCKSDSTIIWGYKS